MRRLAAVLLLLLLCLPTAAGLARHDVQIVTGSSVGVVEELGVADGLSLPVPTGARVDQVTRDGRSVAWAMRDGRVHASAGPGNYTVSYRVQAGRVDLVRTAEEPIGNASVRADLGPGWSLEAASMTLRSEDGATVAEASGIDAGQRWGVRLVPPTAGGPGANLVPFVSLLLVGLAVAGGVAIWKLKEPGIAEMGFWDHYRELRHRFILTLVPLGLAFFAFFLFALEPVVVGGVEILAPIPSETGGMAAQVFAFFKDTLLPAHVELIVTHPVDAILAEIQVALFLAVVATSPIAAYHAARFLGPAMHERERRTILKAVPAITGLFLVGCLFGLLLVVPFAFEFLYGYGVAIGAVTFVTAGDFIGFTVLLVLAFGFSFELPVAMVALSELDVRAEFWADNWRMAVVVIFVFAAFITPDGSGVTMFMVGLPLCGLYVLGWWLVRRRERRA